MNKRSYIATALVIILSSLASNAQNKISIDIVDFEKIYVKGHIDLELIPSTGSELTITSRTLAPEELEVEFKNKAVHLKTKTKINSEEKYQVKLPYEVINLIEASTGAVVNSARDIETPDLQLKASAGGKIEISIQSKKIEATVTQVSDIILYGTTDQQEVDAKTGGNYLAYELDCKHTTVEASAGSQAKVTASESITATAKSKAFIGYIGAPGKTTISTSLGGEITSYKTRQDLHD